MICIILVAGHGVLLEQEIKQNPIYQHLQGVPKALLPGVGGKKILDYWWEAVNTRQLFSDVFLVTNADKYKHYERWATASDFSVENIVNDGTTTLENRLGAVNDLDLVLRTKNVDDDIMVIAGDMLFQDDKFDIAQVVNYFNSKQDGDLAIYYEMLQEEVTSTRGIVEVCPETNRITKFFEKPGDTETFSRNASVVFYCFRKKTLKMIPGYLTDHPKLDDRNFGHFFEWLINTKKHTVYGMKLPTGFQLIGQVGLNDYQRWLSFFSGQIEGEGTRGPITKRAYARVGLMGNPSDGFHGKTIALSIANFWAEVTIQESEKLVLMPHPLNDPTEFGGLGDLFFISRKEGYLGGLRLLQATCKKFYQYCSKKGISLGKRNFSLRYDTNIPRQVGLAGSSAIVVATLKCLMHFFNITDNDLAKPLQASFVLGVEKEELGIQGGLQDRVIQIFEGLVYMDFDKDMFEKQGYGNYQYLNMEQLPTFFLAYIGDPSDSGKIHSEVAIRWRNGEKEVVDAMNKFGQLTNEAKTAFENQDWQELASLMNANFDLRKSIYGEKAIGEANLKMISIGRNHGAAVKFPGSGGAVVGLCLNSEVMSDLKREYQENGYVMVEIMPHPGGMNHDPPVAVI